ncbi:hypothetical protein [Thermococcus sp. 21S7]|uniref:hypothetical protein n=1 Tax=Thermococcus sp. 21S7 TaxID=1638221 RepID=UPI001438E408|nr:hypothetical protein [Thermococcus sp. 21S7]NJE61372.1 hypothetical protein [Thermococcus sp. 21S7]
MLVGKLLNPSYRVRVIKAHQLDEGKVLDGFRRAGFHVSEVGKDLDPELSVESFLSSSYGNWIYVIRLKRGRVFLARGEGKVPGLKSSDSDYLVRDDNGLKRLLIREVSKKAMLLIEVPRVVVWGLVWWLIWKYFEEYPLGTFLLFFLGFVLNDLASAVEYFVIGYCRE